MTVTAFPWRNAACSRSLSSYRGPPLVWPRNPRKNTRITSYNVCYTKLLRYVTDLERAETQRYLEMFYTLQFRPLAEAMQ